MSFPLICSTARGLASKFRSQSRARPSPERMWILPNASVVIHKVRRDGRSVSRPKVVRSTSRATVAARARSLCVIMLMPYTLTSVSACSAGATRVPMSSMARISVACGNAARSI